MRAWALPARILTDRWFAADETTCPGHVPRRFPGRDGNAVVCVLGRAVDGDERRPVQCPLLSPQSAEQIAALCRSLNATPTPGMDGPREGQDPPPRPLARHLSDADRLRKVIQELLDTEKSYVKVPEGQCVPSALPGWGGRGMATGVIPGGRPLDPIRHPK